MCGIFGAQDLKTYEQLYYANCERGNFAGGSLYIASDNSLYLKKWEGVLPRDRITGEFVWTDEYTTFLGHTQSPTGAQRSYNVTTTHPFEHGWFIIAHNGVLENHEELRNEHLLAAGGSCKDTVFDTSNLPVDSAVIPALLDELYVGDDVLAIKETFGGLKGTFACWVHSKHTSQTYLVRSGSTLFGDIENSIFSSIMVPGLAEDEIEEGAIFCITHEGLANVGHFSQNSPFFIL